MSDPVLLIFDVDGTLLDSKGVIVAAMEAAFEGEGLPAPAREEVLGAVGLSLPELMAAIRPDLTDDARARLAHGYRSAFQQLRARTGAQAMPLFPGARPLLDALSEDPGTLLAIATGKSVRGVAHFLEMHGLEGRFLSVQTADTHPSKPHPSMVQTAMAETGTDPERTLMIGDTSFDMEMARAAGAGAMGVAWGHHRAEALVKAGAHEVAETMGALQSGLAAWRGRVSA